MALSLPHGLQCSSCKRPKQSLLYKTCEACRLKCRRHWRRHRPVAAESLHATSLQSIAHSMNLVSSSHPGSALNAIIRGNLRGKEHAIGVA
jgi:hypothetical protein